MNKTTFRSLLASLLTGLLFGAGLVISGMTRPSKVLGFLDVGGAWDASLLCVMAGGIAVHMLGYRLARRRRHPFFERGFAIPHRRDIDLRLVLGAVLFGAGWGLAGYCPGPSLVALGSGHMGVVIFVAAMLAGWFAATSLQNWFAADSTHNKSEMRLR